MWTTQLSQTACVPCFTCSLRTMSTRFAQDQLRAPALSTDPPIFAAHLPNHLRVARDAHDARLPEVELRLLDRCDLRSRKQRHLNARCPTSTHLVRTIQAERSVCVCAGSTACAAACAAACVLGEAAFGAARLQQVEGGRVEEEEGQVGEDEGGAVRKGGGVQVPEHQPVVAMRDEVDCAASEQSALERA
eukprot:490329-Pleurochrysis_carterae.AAC.1